MNNKSNINFISLFSIFLFFDLSISISKADDKILGCAQELTINSSFEQPELSPSQKSTGIYLEILSKIIQEISILNPTSNDLQITFLSDLLSHKEPTDPMISLHRTLLASNNPEANTLILSSYFLGMLNSKNPFPSLFKNLNSQDWASIIESVEKRLAEMAYFKGKKAREKINTIDHFLDVPDAKGRVRLHLLILNGNWEEAERIVRDSRIPTRYINSRDQDKKTPLDMLLSLHPQTGSQPASSYTDLSYQSLYEAIKGRGGKSSTEMNWWDVRLLDDIEGNNIHRIKMALELGANPNHIYVERVPVRSEHFAIHFAAEGDNPILIDLLIAAGADPDQNALGYKDRPPLYYAVKFSRVNSVRSLLEHGANPNVVSEVYGSLMHLAVTKGNLEIVKLLVKYGIKLDVRDSNGNLPFHLLASHLFFNVSYDFAKEILQLTRDAGVDLNTLGGGHSLASVASRRGFDTILRALSDMGANLDF